MMIPSPMEKLNEADVTFSHAPGEEAVPRIGSRFGYFRSVHFEDVLRFFRDVRQFGYGFLHAECHFLLSDGGLDLGVSDFLLMLGVDLPQGIEHPPSYVRINSLGV